MSSDLTNAPGTPPRILIIDDEIGARASGSVVFAYDGYVPVCVASVDEGLAALKTGGFVAILLDVMMPGKSGLQGLRELRGLYPDIPIIMLTASHTIRCVVEAMRLGATDYVTKPYDIVPIRRILKQHIADAGQPSGMGSPRVVTEPSSPQWTDDVLCDLVAAFIHNLTGQLENARILCRALAKEPSEGVAGSDGSSSANSNRLSAALDSASYMLRRFRNVLGRSPGLLRLIDMNEMFADLQRHFESQYAAQLTFAPPESTCLVEGDRELLWHTFENLIRNGLEALGESKAGTVQVKWWKHFDADLVQVSVKDTGCGINSADMQRIFDVNFTTKPRGLGIGLYLVRRAIAFHHGALRFRSSPGHGTEFSVCLPAAQPK